MPKQVAIYTRVSTDHQTTENQERELQAIADRMGWTVVKVYRDQGISGAKSRTDRAAFDALWKGACPTTVRHHNGVVRGPTRQKPSGPCGLPL
jgi:hypothetical protein